MLQPSGPKSQLPTTFPNRKAKQILDDTGQWFNCLCGIPAQPATLAVPFISATDEPAAL